MLIKDNRIVDDPWTTVDEHDPLPPVAPVIVPLARWQAERAALNGRLGAVGVRLRSDEAPALIARDLQRFEVVVLEFPKFTDGRAYSYARTLRERYGYTGEVRATGDVLRDQLAFMQRAGFDAFEVADTTDVAAVTAALAEVDVWYQRAADARASVPELRHNPETVFLNGTAG